MQRPSTRCQAWSVRGRFRNKVHLARACALCVPWDGRAARFPRPVRKTMSGRRSQSAFRLVVLSAALAALVLTARTARAEDMIIKRPGDHPVYSVEIEPHLALAFFVPTAGSSGVGLGGRFTIPIVKNGFISSINNSVGIGFGLDWISYNGCYRGRWANPYSCPNFQAFFIPVVMQWNFFLSTHWSVFGEPGLAITHNSYGAC